jgi:deoxyadenosine/deoxycytidine kinase
MFPYRFIAIEGNIGAGKTTLCEMLSADWNCPLILEQFSDNPFLPLFYNDPERYAFSVELFFMTERHKQLQTSLTQPDWFHNRSIADYFFIKTLIFAKNNLAGAEYRLFKRLFEVLNATFPKPDLLIYLHRPVPQLLSNIQKRGRAYETNFNTDYLMQIQNAYFNYFKSETHLPILILELEDLDFVSDTFFYKQIVSYISKPYSKGIHRIACTSKSETNNENFTH